MQKKLRTLIVEDRADALEELEVLLATQKDIIEIAAIVSSVAEAIRLLSSEPPFDLSILDIGLDDGTCYDLIEIVGRKKLGIIALNTSAEAFDPLKHQVVGTPLWLPKPYSPKRFNYFMYDLMNEVNKTKKEIWSYDILEMNKDHRILWDDQIFYLEGNKGHTNYYYLEKAGKLNMITTKASIGEEEVRLNEEVFQRCHDSYVVNVDRIVSFSRDKKGGILKFNFPGLNDIRFSPTYAKVLFEKIKQR